MARRVRRKQTKTYRRVTKKKLAQRHESVVAVEQDAYDLAKSGLDVRRARFFPVCSLSDKNNYKRLHRIERDGTITDRVFLDVADASHRERLICIHYLRHLTRHFLRDDVGVNVLGRDDPWDFRLASSTGREFNVEITAIADNDHHFELSKREERLTKCSRDAAIPLHEVEKLAWLSPSSVLSEAIEQHRAAGRSREDSVPNPFFQDKNRVMLGVLFQPEQSLPEQIEAAIRKKSAKTHKGKESTILIIDNRTSAFDAPDYQLAAESLQPFLESVAFPEVWFYTGYCSDDDGNRAEFSFAPLKVPPEQAQILEQMSASGKVDDHGKLVW